MFPEKGQPVYSEHHADGLDLGASQFDARLVFILHEIVVEGLAVFGDDLSGFSCQGGRLPSLPQSKVTYIILYYTPSVKSSDRFSGDFRALFKQCLQKRN